MNFASFLLCLRTTKFFCLFFFCRNVPYREKKKEKERDELWRKLAELEISHRRREPSAKTNATGGVALAKQSPPTLK
jgi:hypothetical protein